MSNPINSLLSTTLVAIVNVWTVCFRLVKRLRAVFTRRETNAVEPRLASIIKVEPETNAVEPRLASIIKVEPETNAVEPQPTYSAAA